MKTRYAAPLLALSLLSPLPLRSQVAPPFTTVTALRTAPNEEVAVEDRIQAYGHLCGYYSEIDPVQGAYFGRLGLGLALSTSAARKTGRLFIALSTCKLSLGEMDSAQFYLDKGLNRYRQDQDEEGLAAGMLCKGQYCFATNYLDSAKLYFDDALIKALNNKNYGVAHQCLLSVGKVFHRQGRYGEAILINKACYDYFRSQGDSLGMAKCLNLTGVYLGSVGQFELADTYYGFALQTLNNYGSSLLQAKVMANQGGNLKNWERPEDALQRLSAARAIFLMHGAAHWANICTHNMGDIYSSAHDYAHAIALFTQARDSFNANNSAEDLAMCDFNIAANVINTFQQRSLAQKRSWLSSDTVHINGTVYSLLDCFRTFDGVLDLLRAQPHKEFSIEVFRYISKGYTLLGDTVTANNTYVRAAQIAASPEEVIAVGAIIDEWRKWQGHQDDLVQEQQKYAIVLHLGLLVIPLGFLIVLLAGYSPGIWALRVVFFVFLVFLGEWLKMVADPWIIVAVHENVRLQLTIYMAVGLLFMLAHITGSARFHKYLKRRQKRLKAKRSRAGAGTASWSTLFERPFSFIKRWFVHHLGRTL